MKRQGCYFTILIALTGLLCGCVSGVWTSASLVYNRHNVYKKVSDFKLSTAAHQLLFGDTVFKQPGSVIDLAVFNGDVLVAGHLPTVKLRQELERRLYLLKDYRHLYTQVSVRFIPSSSLEDSWITAKIRSQIIADSNINPSDFKILTVDSVVYVMGDVIPEQAERVLTIAKTCTGVIRVVKLLKYYHLTEKA